jgi:aspartate/methionine/tyrosine aminotransferase
VIDRPALSRTAEAIRASVFADLAPRLEARARRGEDLVELHIGDTHHPPPAAARFAQVEAEGGLYRYGSIAGLDALKAAFAGRLASRGFGPPQVDPASEVLVACGATHALFCGTRAVLDAGDEVLVAAPYCPLAVGVLRAAGGVPVEVPLTSRLNADPSASAAAILERAVTPRTRAIYVTTPNNPDGHVLSEAQLRGVARLAASRNLWILADEVYADYVYDGVHVSIARLEDATDRTVSVYSLSKSHALSGVRVGFAVARSRVISLARRIATHTVFNVPVAAQRVALAAISEPTSWIDAVRRDYREARGVALEGLAGLPGGGVVVPEPGGGSYVFADFAPILRGRPLVALLERAIDRGVLLAPGDGCGEGFETCARLCFTSVPRPRLVEGLARLRSAIADFA